MTPAVQRTPAVQPTPAALPTAAAEQTLRRLELLVTRRLDGLLLGSHLGLLPGAGSEPAESREYRAGDDVRRMDWAVTARTTVPHVRDLVADRELETWVLVDLSASMDFGTHTWEKRDLAIAAVAAVGFLTARTGNRIGAIVAGGGTTRVLPARGGRTALRGLLRELLATPRSTGGGHLATAIDALRRPPRRRGLAVVVSDFLGPSTDEWERALRALRSRQQLLAVEVLDPRELELPNVGVLDLVDPETGALLTVSTRSPKLRARYAAAATEHRAQVAGALRRVGAGHLVLRTDRDWLRDIVRFVVDTRQRQMAGR